MFIIELIKKIKFDLNADRIGPDIPFTHWKLFFKKPMLNLCKRKFKSFGNNSEFRAGAYAIGCSNIEIGSRVVIRPGAMLFAEPKEEGIGIKIEDDVLIGSGVHIYTGNHCFDRLDIPIIDQGHSNFKKVVLKYKKTNTGIDK
jgi:acetyltransferase-like isoleucine patch superfamily enzyme